MTDRITFSIIGVEDAIRVLQSLPAEIVSKRGGPVKTALFRAGKYIRDEERAALKNALKLREEKGLSTGLLLENVVLRRGRRNEFRGERYLVKISKKKYPREGKDEAKPVTTVKTAHLFEYGSEKQEPTPFIRPTFEKTKDRAFSIAVRELDSLIQKTVRRLAKVRKV